MHQHLLTLREHECLLYSVLYVFEIFQYVFEIFHNNNKKNDKESF